MKLGPTLAWSAAALCALAPIAHAQDGSVRIPLSQYEALTTGGGREESAAGYAFSQARVTAVVSEEGEQAVAEVTVEASVEVLTDEWTLVPIASTGAAVTSVTEGGRELGLSTRGGSLVWATQARGVHDLRWTYRADARRFGDGRVLSLGTPPTVSQLTLTVPGADRGVSVIPATGIAISRVSDATRITATLPATGAAQVAWRDEGSGGFTLSRARYQGVVDGDVVRFEAELVVDLDGTSRVRVPLFPTQVALEEVRVDRNEAAIATDEAVFVVPVTGRGRHRIQATFVVPVQRDGGLPRFDLAITPTPVSRFEITLPGERELTVEPVAGVQAVRRDGRTVATFHLPMSRDVSVHWAEAVPEDASEVETRASADLVHVVRPDEGVLAIRAHATFEITRGALSRVELSLPPDVQVNAVTSEAGVVGDWRVSAEGDDRVLSVFLDREVEDALTLDVEYERTWPVGRRTTEAFDVPILRARGVHRQRGMVALLATRELTLEPREEANLSRVGDNALPPSIRDGLPGTVAHTFRYLDEPPRLVAIGAVRAPEPARYDAQVDTLVSLGDVSTTVTTMIEVDVKSGELDALAIRVPEGLNLLEVTAPSLRHYALGEDRVLSIELTQPMEGRFRVEVVCERITGQEEELEVPLLGVPGAEVERGRLGVEALAPFQVDARAVERLSPIEPGELPDQLLLRTDNPILHAYRYAQADPAPRFTVGITRHAEIETPHAVIDEASYRTLYTRDGVAVTTARWMVRNRRQQFLRVSLPAGSEVWSARVDGRPETPALEAGSDAEEPIVLLNIVSAAEAFPVEVVYATRVPALGAFGRLDAELPRVDVVVTRTSWEVFVPSGASYADPVTSMSLVTSGYADAPLVEDLPDAMQLDVPTEGVRYLFQKMYAGRDGETVSLSMPYVAGWGAPFVLGLSGLGGLLLCLGLLAFAVLRLGFPVPAALAERLPIHLATYRGADDVVPPRSKASRRAQWTSLVFTLTGAMLLFASIGYLCASAWPAVLVALFVGLGAIGMVAKRELDRRRAEMPEPPPPAPAG
ncbi:MAG: hypothetical protein H6719_36920 [Sandaracinaceae bacterium]|nr:hypothetical protein [Sandaracinaceae bacterium]